MPHLRPHRSHTLDRRAFVGLGAASAAGLLLAACDGGETANRPAENDADQAALDYEPIFARYEPADEPDGDPAMVTWPDFVLDAPAEIRELYTFHIDSGALMRYIPCFCGCGGSGHRNNRDCYVREVHADGSITFDSMAPT